MAPEQQRPAERLLARLVAQAYAADHPELLRPPVIPQESKLVSGPPATAAAEGSAPLPSAGGPEDWSVEHDDAVPNADAG
jgi:hypothetical protein